MSSDSSPNLQPPFGDFIDFASDAFFMRQALHQAERAFAKEEVPVGAVVVRAGRIIARAFNQVETLKDATAHAEMLALTQAESVVEGVVLVWGQQMAGMARSRRDRTCQLAKPMENV